MYSYILLYHTLIKHDITQNIVFALLALNKAELFPIHSLLYNILIQTEYTTHPSK